MVSCPQSPKSPSQFTLLSVESIKPSEQAFHPVTVEANAKAWSSVWLWKRPWGLKGHAGGIPHWCCVPSRNLTFSGRKYSLVEVPHGGHFDIFREANGFWEIGLFCPCLAQIHFIHFPKYHLLVMLLFASPHLSLPIPTFHLQHPWQFKLYLRPARLSPLPSLPRPPCFLLWFFPQEFSYLSQKLTLRYTPVCEHCFLCSWHS